MTFTIAFVDDSQNMRINFDQLLPSYLPATTPIAIKTFVGGNELLSELRNGSKFDLIFMDNRLLDGETGPMYVSKILQLHDKAQVVGFASGMNSVKKATFLKAGAIDAFDKIISNEVLAQYIVEKLHI